MRGAASGSTESATMPRCISASTARWIAPCRRFKSELQNELDLGGMVRDGAAGLSGEARSRPSSRAVNELRRADDRGSERSGRQAIDVRRLRVGHIEQQEAGRRQDILVLV